MQTTLDQINAGRRHYSLIAISSNVPWGKASSEIVHAVYDSKVLGIIGLDRASSHLAEQIGVKAFVPVIAISSDRALTSANIPWIFRVPDNTPLPSALNIFAMTVARAGPDRSKVRDVLASGATIGGAQFESTGEPKRS